jgi:hypothetical protein
MKTVLLAILLLLVAPSVTLGQTNSQAGTYQPGDAPICNIPFASEFLDFTEWVGKDFTQRVSNLKLLLPDDFISTWADGEVLDKKQFLSLRANPNLQIKRFFVVRGKSYNACLYGYFAIVTGTYVLEGRIGDRDLSGQYRFTAFFSNRPGFSQGPWIMTALHSSHLVQPRRD